MEEPGPRPSIQSNNQPKTHNMDNSVVIFAMDSALFHFIHYIKNDYLHRFTPIGHSLVTFNWLVDKQMVQRMQGCLLNNNKKKTQHNKNFNVTVDELPYFFFFFILSLEMYFILQLHYAPFRLCVWCVLCILCYCFSNAYTREQAAVSDWQRFVLGWFLRERDWITDRRRKADRDRENVICLYLYMRSRGLVFAGMYVYHTHCTYTMTALLSHHTQYTRYTSPIRAECSFVEMSKLLFYAFFLCVSCVCVCTVSIVFGSSDCLYYVPFECVACGK